MHSTWWPLGSLRLTTPRLELRFPTNEDLAALADVAVGGVHDPAVQPFTNAWSDGTPERIGLGNLQYHWSKWGSWKPEDWTAGFVTVLDGAIIGTQSLSATDFAVLKEVRSGSYLGQAWHRQGMGTEMRAAVLELAFRGLGAEYAMSSAYTNNPGSLGVSRRLGYREDGIDRRVVRGSPAISQRLRLSAADWAACRTIPVEIHGLDACLEFMGAAAQAGGAG